MMRVPAPRIKPRLAKTATFPAPTGGWIRNENLATPNARRADGTRVNGAFHLENWFATATGIRLRGGSALHTTVGEGAADVTALFSYMNGNNQKLFAATADAIYDVSTAAPATDTAEVDTLGSGDWSVLQFSTSGGTFLRLVNGVDTPLVFDGTTWATTPAITGVTDEDLSHVWVHQNRNWFVEKDSMNAWYLPVDSIGGAAVVFPLGGVFTRGGSLVFGASWSIESGGGLDDHCAFFSSEGEVAVYAGSDPSIAALWSKVGVYKIGRPLGKNSYIRAGGDLVVATDIGFVPLSVAVQRDFAAIAPHAVSYPIEVAWNEAVESRGSAWPCEVWPSKQMVLVALPTEDGEQAQIFVANARTGAWSLFTGWRATCMETFGERLFFGSVDGLVYEAEVTGSDNELPYTGVCVPQFDPLKAPASLKTTLLGRATVRAPSRPNVQLSLQHDYDISLPAAPDVAVTTSDTVWGSAEWGSSVWGTEPTKQTFQEWQSIPGSGYAIAPAVQVSSGGIIAPAVELVQVDMTYDQGDVVT